MLSSLIRVTTVVADAQEQGSSLTFAQQQAALTAAGNSLALYTLSIVQVYAAPRPEYHCSLTLSFALKASSVCYGLTTPVDKP